MAAVSYTIEKINEILQGELRAFDQQAVVHDLLIDSRKLYTASEALFFAIKGTQHDGHRYLNDLYQKGVRNFVVEQYPANIQSLAEGNFILVPQVLSALQALATYHRLKHRIPVIGITGSNGKTIVKEWLHQLMGNERKVVRSPKSYNSQVGVPLSVWLLDDSADLAIFEAGISKKGEMARLHQIVQPSLGIFTNIGSPHAENFDSVSEKIQEKLLLFTGVKTLFYCRDQQDIVAAIEGADHLRSVGKFTWSRLGKADLQIIHLQKQGLATQIEGTYQGELRSIRIPFTDEASIENALHCWCVCLFFGLSDSVIAERMSELTAVAMRLELKEGINHCTIINDSYNSDIGSLKVALDLLKQQQQHSVKTLILSDMLESSRDEAALYADIAALVNHSGLARLIGVGDKLAKYAQLFKVTEQHFYPSREALIAEHGLSSFSDEAILIKGARKFGFEQLSALLQQQNHETVLEINLNAIVHNLNQFRAQIQPGTKLMAMVKAFSYGSGSYEIANVLQFHQVDYLAVAYADEGIELRKAGIQLPIMVMSPEKRSFDAMIRFRLEPEIFRLELLQAFGKAVQRSGWIEGKSKPFPIHIMLDTGMHRLGFEEHEIARLLETLKPLSHLQVQSVFSHLAASDEAAHDDFTREQLAKFERMSERVVNACDNKVLRHILNSSGIVRFGDAQLDMVRLGIGLYGVSSESSFQNQLQNGSRLKTVISQVKEIPAGETIGYGRRGKSAHTVRIATVAIGYADGLSRALSNGVGKMVIHGTKVPIIGNVCMDMCMLDITGVDAQVGDEVEVFGEHQPIAQLAQSLNTIPYEILAGISRRVKRVYYYE